MRLCLDGRRVLVVCDDPSTSTNILAALSDAGASVNRRASLDAAWDFVARARVIEFDAIVVDLDTPRDRLVDSGLQLALALHGSRAPRPCWVALSGRDTEPCRIAAQHAGAVEMLLKSDHTGRDLVASITRALEACERKAVQEGFRLLPEELALVMLVEQCMTDKEISARTDLSESQVKHRLRVLRKRAKVSNRSGLVGLLRKEPSTSPRERNVVPEG